MTRQGPWTDQQMLHALYMRDHQGKNLREIGKALGRPRNSVVGMMHRMNVDLAQSDPDGNQNGTMKPLWWQEGLRERDRLRKILGLPRENGR
jgi:hypothetical protein